MPRKKNNPPDVEQSAPQKSVIEEAGLDPNQWQVVDAPPVNPNQPLGVSPAPVNNSMSSGPLPPNFGYQPALVNTTYPNSTGPIGLMPIQGGPQFNSKAIGVTKTIIEQGTGGSGGGGVPSPLLLLETNGAVNPNQSVLNIIGGTNVSVASDAGGGVTFVIADTDFYQTIEQAGSAKPQEAILNFLAPITATDNAGNTSTDIAVSVMVGDSGSGGVKGLVPAPGAGDAAAGKFLKADGTFAVPSFTAFFNVAVSGLSAGNNTFPHGLGFFPLAAIIQMNSAAEIWWQATPWDGTNFYFVASDASATCFVIAWGN